MEEKNSTAVSGESGSHNSPIILLAEDEEILRTLLCQHLRRVGYEVIDAPDGEAALALYQSHRDNIVLLITDIMMPRMTGIDLTRHARKLNPVLKVLFISGYISESRSDVEQFAENTFSLCKPFTLRAFSDLIHQILA